MGVHNQQRRAAKKKARVRRRSGAPQETSWAPWQEPAPTTADVRAPLLEVIVDVEQDRTAARRWAHRLLEPGRPLTPQTARAGVLSFLGDLVRGATGAGWSPTDLVTVTRRRASVGHVPLVVGLLHDEAARHASDRVAVAWREDLRRSGASRPLVLGDLDGLQAALELLAVLARLPQLPPVVPAPGTRGQSRATSPSDEKLLARVQALLAKAEATEYDEEADALAAKAQEIVSRHSLDRLLTQGSAGRPGDRPDVRRLWLEAPYVNPKAVLVQVIAEANRCSSVLSEALGCCTLVGSAGDLDAVEVLVPSLLVQAHVALARFGRQADRAGRSRTRSFRQAFLLAYADRIGERLRSADEQVAASTGRGAELVPVLVRHRERVDAAVKELFPGAVGRARRATSAQGWYAGRAAADQAQFGPDLQVTAGRQGRAAS